MINPEISLNPDYIKEQTVDLEYLTSNMQNFAVQIGVTIKQNKSP